MHSREPQELWVKQHDTFPGRIGVELNEDAGGYVNAIDLSEASEIKCYVSLYGGTPRRWGFDTDTMEVHPLPTDQPGVHTIHFSIHWKDGMVEEIGTGVNMKVVAE